MLSSLTVEPPSWWCAHPVRTVRLLIRGEGLRGASLRASGSLTLGKPTVHSKGTTLFVDLTIPEDATPGEYTLQIGAQSVGFTLLPPLTYAPQGLSQSDVIYLVMPDRFCDGDPSNNEPLHDPTRPRHYHGGDFAGLQQKLPYLKELGITAIWMTPIYQNASQPTPGLFYAGEPAIDYHGYGAVDLYAVEPHFGSLAELHALADAAHACGIKLVQDQVPNHVGPQHPWRTNPPTRSWIHTKSPCSFMAWQLMDPYATAAQRRAMTEGWFANVLPDLNVDDPEVERYLIQNSLWWVGIAGFDAVRLDTVAYVSKAFWRQWRAAMAAAFPTLFVVGEVLEHDPALVAFFQDTTIEAFFDFPLCQALRHVFTKDLPLTEIPKVLSHDGVYSSPENLVTFVGLHDQKRFTGLPGGDATALKLAITIAFTVRGIPLLYYGDELGMPGGEDPDNRRHFPGGFPGDLRDAFRAAGRTSDEQSLFRHVQTLCRLRQERRALQNGSTKTLLADDACYIFARFLPEGETIVVAVNGSRRARRCVFDISETSLKAGQYLHCPLTGNQAIVQGGRLSVLLPARTAAILQ